MAKGKSTWKYNKLLTARRNYFDEGGTTSNIFQNAGSDIKTAFTNPGTALKGLSSGNGTFGMTSTLGAAAGAIGDIGEKLLSNGLKSKAGSIVSGVGDALGGIPILGGFAKGALNLVGGGINALFGSKLNQANINAANADISRMNSARADAASFDALGQKMAATAGRAIHGKSFYGRDGVFSSKAKNMQRKLEEEARAASQRQDIAFINNAEDLSSDQLTGLEANYAAFGGPLGFTGGAIDYGFMTDYLNTKRLAAEGQNDSMTSLPNSFAKGGDIHIKPSKKGTFTAAATKHGMGVQEFARKVLANKEDYSSEMIKKANFARNASKWKHALGGNLMTHGADWTNGLIAIENGGSHEENPFEGVPMGVDKEGAPNLVEEGETIFNDYVFSKRLMVPKAVREKYKLRGTKNLSFADASKQLAKESEERPNDPVSERGLVALMSDLADAQETVRETQQIGNYANKMSHGGRMGILYDGKGLGNQTLNYNNSTPNLYFGLSPEVFNPYDANGVINWDTMYSADSPYTKRRQYVLDNWDSEGVQNWLDRYVQGINEYNKSRKGYQPMSKSDITKDIFEKRTWDKNWGGMHAGIDYAGDPEERLVEEHMLRGKDGLTAMPESDIYYKDTNFDTGKTWEEVFGDKYSRVNNGQYTESFDPETHTRTRRYFYDPVESKPEQMDRYYKRNAETGEYELVEGDNPSLQIKNLGNYYASSNNPNDTGGTDYYYDPEEEVESGKYADWLRYAPAVGFGIGAITDALGLTNKPDYSNADAILEATRNAGNYEPVEFNPIGNYLGYTPFDRNFYINKLNAESGATRRAALQNAGLNRGAGMAAILAADANAQNSLGQLARQAEEYNLAQRQKVEDFNRATNITNSQGMLQADIANQRAKADMRNSSLRGTLAAAQMREQARLASDAAKSANLSGLFQTLGDIGYEEKNARMRDWAIKHGIFGPGTEDYGRTKSTTKAKGGKVKRRKRGLTL